MTIVKSIQRFFTYLAYLGVDKIDEPALKSKIITSNTIAILLYLLVGVPASLVTLIYTGSLMSLEPTGIAMFVFYSIWLNSRGKHRLARVINAFVLILALPVYNLMLFEGGAKPVIPNMMLTMSFSIVPFLLFRLSEWREILTIVLCSIAILTFQDKMAYLIELKIDDSFFRDKTWVHYTFVFLAPVAGYACIYTLLRINDLESQRKQQLAEEMQEKQEELKQAEEKLKSNLHKLQRSKEKEKKRNWITQQVSAFVRQLYAFQQVEEMYPYLVREIYQNIQATQVAYFHVNLETEDLELTACYAYNRFKFKEKKTLPLDAGIIGEVYKHQKKKYITNLPEKYTFVSSGHKKSGPAYLLILPFIFNEQVVGIMEIASHKPLGEHQIEYIEKIGEAVASFSTNELNKQQTERLLHKARKSMTENQEQEEELRQNLEELAAMQENMHREEKEYLQTIESLREELNKRKKAKS